MSAALDATRRGWLTPALLLALQLAACGRAPGAAPGASADDAVADEEEAHLSVVLDSAAMELAEIEIAAAETVQSGEFTVTGRVTFDQDRVSHLGPRTEGYVAEIQGDLGDEVRAGQMLAVLESPEVGARRADLAEAELLVKIARENFLREQRLEAQGISSRSHVLDAEAELRRAEAAALRAAGRLDALGATEGEGAEFTIRAPYAGVVVEKHATRGEIVSPSDRLFTVADLSNVWIELDIYERDLHQVAEGQAVTVATAAYPDVLFSGRIVYLADILDEERRTVYARVEVPNTDGRLRPGMFATAGIVVPGAAPVVAVPREAVQSVEGTDAVWVPGDRPGEFSARPVTTGQELAGNRIEILYGLRAGEPLVVRGAFTLKSELAAGDFGDHTH